MTALYCPGVLPAPGDHALITDISALNPTRTGWLRVLWTQPCGEPDWAYLTGTWDDGTAGRAMAWIDRLIVRKDHNRSVPENTTPLTSKEK